MTEDPSFDKLAEFLSRNPESTTIDAGADYRVLRPWGDDTLALSCPKADEDGIRILSRLRLPTRFTAIWHVDTNDVEFIYGFLSLDDDLLNRAFHFSFKGRSIECVFADGSDALRWLALHAQMEKPPGDSGHRNLPQLASFMTFLAERGDDLSSKVKLTSFWVRRFEGTEQELVELSQHLNFYMYYFDRKTPRILIHEASHAAPSKSIARRYPFGAFPPRLDGRQLDPYLLLLWHGALSAHDAVRAYLYNYQVLEYCAFYYLSTKALQAVRRIIAAPDLAARADVATRALLDRIVEDRLGDDAKIQAVIEESVEPRILWYEIETQMEVFTVPTTFEGGFTLPPLVKEGWTVEDFKTAWIPKVPDQLRKLRNALVHSREQRMAACIAPTPGNHILLKPWASLATAISMQVITYTSVE